MSIGCFLVALFSIVVIDSSRVEAAPSANLSVSPSSGTYTTGNSFTITVYEDSISEPVNVVDVGIRYNASQLQVQSVDASQSAFALGVGTTNDAGYFSTARAAFANNTAGEVSGKQVIVKVTFKVIASSGSGMITFDGSSAIVSKNTSTNIWDKKAAAASYSFYTPPSQVVNAPQNSTTVNTPPVDSQRSTTQSSRNTTITQSPSSDRQNTTEESVTSTPENSEGVDIKKGYLVVIKVLDQKGLPIENATVKLGEQESVQTDKNGLASFVGIIPGTYDVIVSSWNKTTKNTITIKTPSDPAQNLQEFEVKVLAENPLNTTLATIGAGVIAVVVLVLGLWLIKKRFPRQGRSLYGVDTSKIIASNSPSHNEAVENDQTINREVK